MTLGKVKDFLFSKTNRELFVFLFFLLLAGFFWLIMTLNETYEQEVRIPIRITGTPKNAVLTSPETDTLRVTVRDKGYILTTYLYKGMQPVVANFRTYARQTDYGTITQSELKQLLSHHLSASTTIVSIKPETLRFYFTYGDSKRVPVRWRGRVIPEHLYFISDVKLQPDSVTVYAPKSKLDSVNVVYTEQLNYANFRDTLIVDCSLDRAEGVKVVPDKIQACFYTDVLTEATIRDVPIEGINMPQGKRLRTFPGKVDVRFVSGVSVYRQLSAQDFTVVVDYNELKQTQGEKCRLYLKKTPERISKPSLSMQQVDYLIEENDN